MVIKLTGADFSANNIGQVDVPISYLAQTEAILERYSSTQSASVKNALDTFVRGLISIGAYNKIKVLILPFLGANSNEWSMNALNGTLPSNANQFTYAEGGIKYIEDRTAFASFSGITDCYYDDFHISAYNTKTLASPSSYSHVAASAFGGVYYLGMVGKIQGYNRAGSGTLTHNSSAIKISTATYAEGSLHVLAGQTVKSQAYTMSHTASTSAQIGTYSSKTDANYVAGSPIGFLSLGKSFDSATQAQQFNALVTSLMQAVLA